MLLSLSWAAPGLHSSPLRVLQAICVRIMPGRQLPGSALPILCMLEFEPLDSPQASACRQIVPAPRWAARTSLIACGWRKCCP